MSNTAPPRWHGWVTAEGAFPKPGLPALPWSLFLSNRDSAPGAHANDTCQPSVFPVNRTSPRTCICLTFSSSSLICLF